jgi:hypothetical protein
MTEESEHYRLPLGYLLPTTLFDLESEGTQVACDLTVSRTWHTG